MIEKVITNVVDLVFMT